MSNVTYYTIDGNGKRVQVTEEFEKDTSFVGIQTYISDRINAPEGDHSKPSYPGIAEQLDLLWHDINEGKFGKTAKTSSFFTSIKNVKESSPKPSPGH